MINHTRPEAIHIIRPETSKQKVNSKKKKLKITKQNTFHVPMWFEVSSTSTVVLYICFLFNLLYFCQSRVKRFLGSS